MQINKNTREKCQKIRSKNIISKCDAMSKVIFLRNNQIHNVYLSYVHLFCISIILLLLCVIFIIYVVSLHSVHFHLKFKKIKLGELQAL